jgi:hypothetical protein
MKWISILSLLVAGIFIFASPGVIQAGSEMRSSGMEGAISEEVPEVGSFEYQEALETGSLPAKGGLTLSEEHTSNPLSPDVEIGGTFYRGGIDTQ